MILAPFHQLHFLNLRVFVDAIIRKQIHNEYEGTRFALLFCLIILRVLVQIELLATTTTV